MSGGLGRPGSYLRALHDREQEVEGTIEELDFYSHDANMDVDETGMRGVGAQVFTVDEDSPDSHSKGFLDLMVCVPEKSIFYKHLKLRYPVSQNTLNSIARGYNFNHYVLKDPDGKIIESSDFPAWHRRIVFMEELEWAKAHYQKRRSENETITIGELKKKLDEIDDKAHMDAHECGNDYCEGIYEATNKIRKIYNIPIMTKCMCPKCNNSAKYEVNKTVVCMFCGHVIYQVLDPSEKKKITKKSTKKSKEYRFSTGYLKKITKEDLDKFAIKHKMICYIAKDTNGKVLSIDDLPYDGEIWISKYDEEEPKPVVDPTLICELCSSCPKCIRSCPGMTEGDLLEGAECNTMQLISIDGKKFGILKTHIVDYTEDQRKLGKTVVIL